MASRKKDRFLGQIFIMDKLLKNRNCWHKKVFIIG